MKLPNWLAKDRPGSHITIELEVKNLKDLDRLERTMERFARHMEKSADASERLADALERAGMGKIDEAEGQR